MQVFHRDAAPSPSLLGSRIEDRDQPTVLMYGHGDAVTGVSKQRLLGLSPFEMTERDGHLYGRGTADDKGQHSVNLAAVEAVLAVSGRLGFNLKSLMKMSKEYGSPVLAELCADVADALTADTLIAPDGPRIGPNQLTIFLGARRYEHLFGGRGSREIPPFRQRRRAAGKSWCGTGSCRRGAHRSDWRMPGSRTDVRHHPH